MSDTTYAIISDTLHSQWKVIDTVHVLMTNPPELIIPEEDNTVAIITIFVSIIALGYSIWYNRKTLTLSKKHHRFSVTPNMTFYHSMLFQEENEWLEITNSGLGPALITSLRFIYNGHEYVTITDLYEEENPNNMALISLIESKTVLLHGSTALAAIKSMLIYRNEYISNNHFSDLFEFIKGVTLRIEYESIYGEKQVMELRIYQ